MSKSKWGCYWLNGAGQTVYSQHSWVLLLDLGATYHFFCPTCSESIVVPKPIKSLFGSEESSK